MHEACSPFRSMLVGSTLLLLGGCASQTLFQSNFDTTIGQPPTPTQQVGTAAVFGPSGGAVIVASPVTTGGRWLQVSRTTADVGMQGKFAQFLGDGNYTFDATVFMPTGAGVASISFEPSSASADNPLQYFLHIDLMPDNSVRIDDLDSTKFGTFPRDQPFIVQVTLQIQAPQSTAHIVLGGTSATGIKDYTIAAPYQANSRQFGAIRIWQGYDNHGAFDATNVVVTRRVQ